LPTIGAVEVKNTLSFLIFGLRGHLFFVYPRKLRVVWATLCCQGMQPFQVPGHADQIPLSTDGLHPAEQELPEAHDRLDDSENRFDGAFSFGVKGSAVCGFHPVLHLGDGIGLLG
jgi:hypothetical protein